MVGSYPKTVMEETEMPGITCESESSTLWCLASVSRLDSFSRGPVSRCSRALPSFDIISSHVGYNKHGMLVDSLSSLMGRSSELCVLHMIHVVFQHTEFREGLWSCGGRA